MKMKVASFQIMLQSFCNPIQQIVYLTNFIVPLKDGKLLCCKMSFKICFPLDCLPWSVIVCKRQQKYFKAETFSSPILGFNFNIFVHFTMKTKLCFYYKLTSMIYIRDPPSCFHKVCGKKLCSLSFNSNSSLLAERTFGKIKFLRVCEEEW